MSGIELPISKSIANRLLMMQAMHGDPLMEVTCSMPDDVRLLRGALSLISANRRQPVTVDCKNCGTALRFLTAYCAQLPGCDVVLDGIERMYHRPIGQLVDVLVRAGARIEYIGETGFPPLRVYGQTLTKSAVCLKRPLSSQFVSALLLAGFAVNTNCHSPYIDMTERLIDSYSLSPRSVQIEPDWSAAAFWYEYIALHGGELSLPGLHRDSIQGDRVVADLFKPVGVATVHTDSGVIIRKEGKVSPLPRVVSFCSCPDLYPAVALTYHCLHKPLIATGTGSLPLKESDRLAAVRLNTKTHSGKSFGDHRIAMALLAADMPCDDTACISKSYPLFMQQLNQLPSL
ncbi:MAG: hypothetical protein MJZ64_05015 [Paludibacteraceae bacterium]|nr:hypothetical protein [Paludibacteraceae bacterium]